MGREGEGEGGGEAKGAGERWLWVVHNGIFGGASTGSSSQYAFFISNVAEL